MERQKNYGSQSLNLNSTFSQRWAYLVLADRGCDGHAEESDGHANAAPDVGRSAPSRDGGDVLLPEVDDRLDQERTHERSGVTDDLEDTTEPEVASEHVVERPRKARLLAPVDLAPLRFESGAALTVTASAVASKSLHGPLRAFVDAGLDLTVDKARIPIVGCLDAGCPCCIELCTEVSGLTAGVHLPEVGRLEGALVSEALEWYKVRVDSTYANENDVPLWD